MCYPSRPTRSSGSTRLADPGRSTPRPAPCFDSPERRSDPIRSDDYALAIACLFFCGGIGGVLASDRPGAAFMVAIALELLAVAAIWAARDAANVPDEVWRNAGRSKAVWRNVLLFFAPLGLGGLAAVAYFAAVRPQLESGGGVP